MQVFRKFSAMPSSLSTREPEFCAMLSSLLTREFSCKGLCNVSQRKLAWRSLFLDSLVAACLPIAYWMRDEEGVLWEAYVLSLPANGPLYIFSRSLSSVVSLLVGVVYFCLVLCVVWFFQTACVSPLFQLIPVDRRLRFTCRARQKRKKLAFDWFRSFCISLEILLSWRLLHFRKLPFDPRFDWFFGLSICTVC